MTRNTTCKKCDKQTRFESDSGKNKCTYCGTKFWATSGNDGKWFCVEIWNEKDLMDIECHTPLLYDIGGKEKVEEIRDYLNGATRTSRQQNVLDSIWKNRDSREAASITDVLITALKESNSEIVQAMNTAQKKRLEDIHVRYLLHAESVDNEWEKDMRWLVSMLRELHISFRESDDNRTY